MEDSSDTIFEEREELMVSPVGKCGLKAIICSTRRIIRHEELVLGVAEKWCPETNTFIFPWGEATVTLEDVLFNGGFPVLVQPVSSLFVAEDERKIYENPSAVRAKARTDCVTAASYTTWLEYFMGRGSEFEHEEFLSARCSLKA
ncbi:unnamed protein product [Dovyalis caffra]|uniref:Aminotransferase-like plant mobile domain-containing protein n=1 Tax=Dovyalis caffra TaxID=77055 RepID=A0AAV1RP03_9ROSI|nr:unnamed protein product [Dovyalis caffra]